MYPRHPASSLLLLALVFAPYIRSHYFYHDSDFFLSNQTIPHFASQLLVQPFSWSHILKLINSPVVFFLIFHSQLSYHPPISKNAPSQIDLSQHISCCSPSTGGIRYWKDNNKKKIMVIYARSSICLRLPENVLQQKMCSLISSKHFSNTHSNSLHDIPIMCTMT